MLADGRTEEDTDDLREIEQRALRLLVNREHSRAELSRKLRSKGLAAEPVETVLDLLEAQNALSDRRFTDQYIASRRAKGFGPNRIRMELAKKGIESGLVQQYLVDTDPEWELALQQTERRRFGKQMAADLRERAKRARFLEYRGFSAESIRRLLQSQ